MIMPEQAHERFTVPEGPKLDYEVTIFDHQMGLSVMDEVKVTRYGTTCLIHEFSRLSWTDVARIMVALDEMNPPLFSFHGHIDDDNPYTLKVVKAVHRNPSDIKVV